MTIHISKGQKISDLFDMSPLNHSNTTCVKSMHLALSTLQDFRTWMVTHESHEILRNKTREAIPKNKNLEPTG